MTFTRFTGFAALALSLSAGAATACPFHQQTFSDWDADQDRQLTQAEFETGMEAGADFAGLDTDESGALSQAEFEAYTGENAS